MPGCKRPWAHGLASSALFLWSFALFFHLCNGIRHLFWDAGYGFEMKTVDASGLAALVATAILTAITWLLAFMYSGAQA